MEVGSKAIPDMPGVYAVFDKDGTLQYMGLSRKVATSVGMHAADLPDECAAVKFDVVVGGGKEELQGAWKQWMTEVSGRPVPRGALRAVTPLPPARPDPPLPAPPPQHMEDAGAVPPGNQPGVTKWQARRKVVKPDIKLTAGKGMDDVTVSMGELVDMVVRQNRVVAFIKGTRTEPQCGFSHKMLTILNTFSTVDYEVVNVLDEVRRGRRRPLLLPGDH